MSNKPAIDGVLIQWGDRLFYPGNRIVRSQPLPRFHSHSSAERASVIRARIMATVAARAPQVMVKVTGGGRGLNAIAAHFRYISKHGRLKIENELGETLQGKDSVCELLEDWRFGGALIEEVSHRREAFNIMLSMPRGTDPEAVLGAAREFARAELADHKYVLVLHDHQANPHVHLSVRAESTHGKRLNPRKPDLQRWRETFAEKLRDMGIDAEATRQTTRGQSKNYESLWRIKAREGARLRSVGPMPDTKLSDRVRRNRDRALEAWDHIERALARSENQADRALASSVAEFLAERAGSQTQIARGRTEKIVINVGRPDFDRA